MYTCMLFIYVDVHLKKIFAIKVGSHYDASQRICKNRTNFYSSDVVQMGMRRHASIGNCSEPASSELRDAMHHTVNQPYLYSMKGVAEACVSEDGVCCKIVFL